MSERLELLRPYLSCYKRRFAVLDFGAGINVPAIGPEIAREFDAVVTCAEKNIEYPEPTPTLMSLRDCNTDWAIVVVPSPRKPEK